MGPIGKDSDIVNLLHAKTKIAKRDIIDLLRALPECMAEAFILSNTDEKKPVDLGGIAISWHTGRQWGSWLTVKMGQPFKKHYTKLKVEQKHPLAVKLYKLMHPINREKAIKRCKSTDIIT